MKSNVDDIRLKNIADEDVSKYVGGIFGPLQAYRSEPQSYLLLPAFDSRYALLADCGDFIVHIDNFIGAETRIRLHSGMPELPPDLLREFFPEFTYKPWAGVHFVPQQPGNLFLHRHKWLKNLVAPEKDDVPLGHKRCWETLENHWRRVSLNSCHIVYSGNPGRKDNRYAILFSCARSSESKKSANPGEAFGIFDPVARRLICGPVTPRRLAREFPNWCVTEKVKLYFDKWRP